MEKYLEALKECPLFSGIDEPEMRSLLGCLTATKRHYERNQFIFLTGDRVTLIGIVLSGSVHIIQEDFWGNRKILEAIEVGGLFGEGFSCAETDKLPVGMLAVQPSDILLIDYRKIINTCPAACVFHAGLIKNMVKILAKKNVMLTQKIEFLTRHTTREKVLAYLSAQAQQSGSNAFTIPFSRQELADYLSVDRSAMSNELSKMRDEGILSFHRSRFELLGLIGLQ